MKDKTRPTNWIGGGSAISDGDKEGTPLHSYEPSGAAAPMAVISPSPVGHIEMETLRKRGRRGGDVEGQDSDSPYCDAHPSS